MIYIVDFIKFLFEQFTFIFEIGAKFLQLFEYIIGLNLLNDLGLPPWLMLGFWAMFFIPVIFRITQIIPIIGGFDS